MLQYSNEQLATVIGVPIVTILLLWTVVIFHKNRKKWSSYDIAIVAVLVQSVLRNLAVLAYTALLIARRNALTSDYCRAAVWVFNSIHTFQASSLTTLAVIALFTVKLYRKQQNLQQYLTPTHIIYHLFCLTTLCACVGVAAILAQEGPQGSHLGSPEDYAEQNKTCKFMPFELDLKFNVFIIVLHVFLAAVSFTSFVCICFNHLKIRRQGFDYLKKSTSDLSELSLSLTASVVNPNENANGKAFYDTYTIQRTPHADGNFENGYDSQAHQGGQGHNYQNGYCNGNRETVWNSDLSNLSMTVSSTNSKRPCLNKSMQEDQEVQTGLNTMYPVLTVCYLFNHLPVIALCICPSLVVPWPVSGVALWMGQLQDVLIPIGLSLVDSRFCKWVSKVYKCSERHKAVDKVPPGVGLDGKFRHFGSQPQSLEVAQTHVERPRGYSPTEPKFPITNGSLYTSIDGRLPIIHNYRRHKEQRGYQKPMSAHSMNVNLHSSHLKRQEYVRPRPDIHFAPQILSLEKPSPHASSCAKCDHFPNQLNLNPQARSYMTPSFSLHQQVVHREASFKDRAFDNERPRNPRNPKPLQKRISLSQDSLCMLPVLEGAPSAASKREVSRRKAKGGGKRPALSNRMSKSDDCLNDLQKDLQRFKQNPEVFQKSDHPKPAQDNRQDLSCVSSDDEYFTDSVNLNDGGVDYDAISQSSYSITTEANCDFDFYQSKDISDIGPSVERVQSFDFTTFTGNDYGIMNESKKPEFTTFKQLSQSQNQVLSTSNFTEAILARSNSRCSKNSASDLNNMGRNFKITRSNSKRSLENFQAYIDEGFEFLNDYKIQRSNSFMTIEDRKKKNTCNRSKNACFPDDNNDKSSYYNNNTKNLLQNLNSSIAYLEDMYNHNLYNQENYNKSKHRSKVQRYGGSVPDFKKIFISEYI